MFSDFHEALSSGGNVRTSDKILYVIRQMIIENLDIFSITSQLLLFKYFVVHGRDKKQFFPITQLFHLNKFDN